MASLQIDEIQAPPAVDIEHTKGAAVVVEAVEESESSSTDEKEATTDDWVYPHPTSFTITERPIDEIQQLKVRRVAIVMSVALTWTWRTRSQSSALACQGLTLVFCYQQRCRGSTLPSLTRTQTSSVYPILAHCLILIGIQGGTW